MAVISAWLLALAGLTVHAVAQTGSFATPVNSFTSAASNGTISIPSTLATIGATPTTTVQGSTGVAYFTIDGASYGATAVSGVAVLAGYSLTPGGAGAMVGGESVSAISDGIVFDGQTALYSEFSSTSSSAAGTVTSTNTQETSTRAGTGSAQSGSATGASSSTPNAAVAMATGMAAAMGGVAGLMAILA